MGTTPGMMGQPGPSQQHPQLVGGIPYGMVQYLQSVQKPSTEQMREGIAEVARMREKYNRERISGESFPEFIPC